MLVDEAQGIAPFSAAVVGNLDDWSITFVDALQPGGDYLVAWYADAFAFASCDYPTPDPAWSADVTDGAEGDVTLDVPFDRTPQDPNACDWFDLL